MIMYINASYKKHVERILYFTSPDYYFLTGFPIMVGWSSQGR